MMFPIHGRFPTLMPIIGRLLVDYAELELDLLNCVQVARGHDMNSTLKTMFRVRGEMNRIKIADALGRVPYSALKLEAEFGTLIDAFDYCRRIRNKYAHAYWHDPDNGKALCYVSLEELADEDGPVNGLTNLAFYYLDEPTSPAGGLLRICPRAASARELRRAIQSQKDARKHLCPSNCPTEAGVLHTQGLAEEPGAVPVPGGEGSCPGQRKRHQAQPPCR
jgi:hypothetical protein